MRGRVFVLALAAIVPAVVAMSPSTDGLALTAAEAMAVRAASIDDLVAESEYVVIATAGDPRSEWEDFPTGRRIVTYTPLHVERAVIGAPANDLWVRTLGGAVGDIAQVVPGEARIAPSSRALFFLAKRNRGLVVTEFSQGHFPVVLRGGAQRLGVSPDSAFVMARRTPALSAREVLVGATVDDAIAAVTRANASRHAQK